MWTGVILQSQHLIAEKDRSLPELRLARMLRVAEVRMIAVSDAAKSFPKLFCCDLDEHSRKLETRI